jgi:hypothetical protein
MEAELRKLSLKRLQVADAELNLDLNRLHATSLQQRSVA